MKSTMLFIAASPLQLLNCIEAVAHYNPSEAILILTITNLEKNTKQLLNLLKMYSWQEIRYITLPSSYLDRLLYAYEVHKKFQDIKTKQIEKIFVGEFRSEHINHLVNYFSVEDITLVDDGLAILQFKNDKNNQSFYHRLRTILYRLFFYNLKAIDYSFYSIYPIINNKQSIINNYTYIKKHMRDKTIEKQVFFIGQPLIELSILSKEVFEDELCKIIQYYKNKQFVYILHRRQQKEYIKELSNKYEFKYLEFDSILEIEMILSQTIPSDIATFYSSAITTLNILLNQPVFTTFKLNVDNEELHESLKKCYLEFKDKDIQVISL